MTTVTSTDLRERVSQLLHVALVELRALSLDHAPHRQIADLADAVENFPTYLLHEPTIEEWDMVKFCLKNYTSNYPESGWSLVHDLDAE